MFFSVSWGWQHPLRAYTLFREGRRQRDSEKGIWTVRKCTVWSFSVLWRWLATWRWWITETLKLTKVQRLVPHQELKHWWECRWGTQLRTLGGPHAANTSSAHLCLLGSLLPQVPLQTTGPPCLRLWMPWGHMQQGCGGVVGLGAQVP